MIFPKPSMEYAWSTAHSGEHFFFFNTFVSLKSEDFEKYNLL